MGGQPGMNTCCPSTGPIAERVQEVWERAEVGARELGFRGQGLAQQDFDAYHLASLDSSFFLWPQGFEEKALRYWPQLLGTAPWLAHIDSAFPYSPGSEPLV